MNKFKIPRYIVWIIFCAVGFLLLMSLYRLLMLYKWASGDYDFTTYKKICVLGFRYDLRMVAIVSLLLFIIGTFPALNPIRKKIGKQIAFSVWFIAALLALIFYTADFLHYSYLQQRLNASVLLFLDDAAISFSMLWQSYPIGWIILFFLVGMFLIMGMIKLAYRFVLKKKSYATKRSRWIWGIGFSLFLVVGIVGNIVYKGGQYPLRWSDAYRLKDDTKANLALNPFQSFFSTLVFKTSGYDVKKINHYYNWICNYLDMPLRDRDSARLSFKRMIAPNPNPITQAPIENIVLVICESFSSYKSTMFGNPLNTSPYFAAMCKQGVFFERAFTPCYGTARGVWATLIGTPDVQIGSTTTSRNPAAVNQHCIMNDFKGYEKYYFLGGSTSWANIRGVLENNIQGIHIYEKGSYQSPEKDVWGISDKNLFLEANAVLKKSAKPFFAIIQTADNHRPYTISREDNKDFEIKELSKKELEANGFENLDEYNSFRYTDYCIQKFIEQAKQAAYFSKTLFVFIGDHGIKGDATKNLPAYITTMGLTNMHVPFLFYAPGLLSPAKYSLPVSQIDVMPSIAALCNIPYTNTTLGRNVFDLIKKKDNTIFLFDYATQQIGVLNNQYFYNYQIGKPANVNFLSIDSAVKPTLETRDSLNYMTNALYETSKYLLLNNKKLQ